MNKLKSLVILLLVPVLLQAQTGKVFDNLTLQSKILKMERRYALYLPPDYETSQRSYPVLYLLHGYSDNQTGWVQFGEVQHIADEAINSGKATPMIIVMPDADSGIPGYVNDAKGDWRYEDFFFQEFMPYIEKTYRIRPDKHYRAVAGLSMGGGGSFYFALHHPELFSSACPLSAATDAEIIDSLTNFKYTKGISDKAKKDYYNNYNVLYLIEHMPADQKKAVRWYIDCGDDDFLYEGNSRVHIAMRKNEIPHEFRVRDGVHNWVYWRTALPEVLDFVSMAFHQF
jgi:enterochelin esterase-like enzyme